MQVIKYLVSRDILQVKRLRIWITTIFLTENGGNLSPGELCTLMGIGSGRTADALKTLEQKRLIERRSDEYDKRKVIVFITDDGKSLIEKRRNEAREKIAETLLLLGDDDAKEFMRILSKINSFR